MKYPDCSRHCGSCKFWQGVRKQVNGGVELDEHSKGKCSKSGNVNYNKETIAFTACPQWAKI